MAHETTFLNFKLEFNQGLYKSILIWQRDSLSIEIDSRKFAKQKMDYIHYNLVSGKWNLAKDYLDYYYSSARFYETGVDELGFLNNLFHGDV